jgi:iron complex transport system substrate-binding protein
MDLLARVTLRFALALAACAWCAASARAEVRVLDADGLPVVLAQPALRIVSLAPHLTELLFAIGAGDRVVGTVEHADFPEAARSVPRVGDSALLDLERIVALQPDLVLVWRHGNSPQQLQRLAALKIPTYAHEARALADIARGLRDLGVLTGRVEAAAQRADAFERMVSDLRARYAGRRALRVFYQVWPQPLITFNGEHLVSQVLALCGAHNVFASLRLLTPTVTEEAVLLADPDTIITGWIPAYGGAPLDGWTRLTALRAVRAGHLLTVNPDLLHRQSDRVVLGARELCEKLDAVRSVLPAAR